MPTIGPFYPTSQAQDAINGGGKDWSFSGNATADDGNPADCTFDVGSTSKSKMLVVTGFGITTGDLPEGAILDEVNFEVEQRADYYEFSPLTYIGVTQAKLYINGSTLGNYISFGTPTTSEAVTPAQDMLLGSGGPTDSDVRNSTFGLAIEYENFDESGTNTNRVYVDFIRISSIVYHTATAPTAPQSPSATADANSINLAWSAPSSDGGSAITAYKVYRGTSSGNLSLYQTLGVVTSYDDTSVTPGTRYYYAIVATNAIGDSSQSSEVNALVATGYKNILMLGVG